jgi:hypothetical protein
MLIAFTVAIVLFGVVLAVWPGWEGEDEVWEEAKKKLADQERRHKRELLERYDHYCCLPEAVERKGLSERRPPSEG